MNKKKTILVTVLSFFAIFILCIGQYIIWGLAKSKDINYTEKFITSSPVNLDQLSSISYFRSCEGHTFPGYNVNGEYERGRSMKHYLTPTREFKDSIGKVEAFAPFDGVIETVAPVGISNKIFSERGKAVYIKHKDSNWFFQFFHIDPVEGIKEGAEVKSGELIGYAYLKDAGNFDMALFNGLDNSLLAFFTTEILGYDYPPFFLQIDSPFNYFNDEVREYFLSYTIPVDSMEISKEFRDENKCDFNKYDPEGNFYTWVTEEYFNPGSDSTLN